MLTSPATERAPLARPAALLAGCAARAPMRASHPSLRSRRQPAARCRAARARTCVCVHVSSLTAHPRAERRALRGM
eukprot:425471-Prymnesium_polylepis.1